ncbi:MAG: hypothetical protein ACMZ7B_00250 [Balneola sp.]
MKKELHNERGLSRLETDLEQFLKREEAKLERTHKSYSSGKPPDRGKNFFKDKPLGRFLSGRSGKGRAVRRVGLASLGFGGINILGLGPEINQLTTDAQALLDQVNELILLIGALLTTLSHIIDRLEQYHRITEEREKEEGKIPAIKKVLRAVSQQQQKENKTRE